MPLASLVAAASLGNLQIVMLLRSQSEQQREPDYGRIELLASLFDSRAKKCEHHSRCPLFPATPTVARSSLRTTEK
ncbi:MAG TPA: hypothetical protein VI072_13790 [Polyangiaceae bacterium]